MKANKKRKTPQAKEISRNYSFAAAHCSETTNSRDTRKMKRTRDLQVRIFFPLKKAFNPFYFIFTLGEQIIQTWLCLSISVGSSPPWQPSHQEQFIHSLSSAISEQRSSQLMRSIAGQDEVTPKENTREEYWPEIYLRNFCFAHGCKNGFLLPKKQIKNTFKSQPLKAN